MISPYLIFRIKQLGRFLQSIGFVYIFLILVLLSGVFLQGLSNFLQLSDTIILGGFALLSFGALTQRKNLGFLKSTDLNLSSALLVDSVLMGAPVIVLLCISNRWPAGLGVLLICIVISILGTIWSKVPAGQDSSWSKSRINIPLLTHNDFELNFLFRKNYFILIPIYIIALLYAWHPASIFVVSFILVVFLQSVFEYYEPKEMIFKGSKPSAFLIRKSLRILIIFLLILLPIFAIGLFYNISYWYLYVLVFFSISLMIAFSVFNKYVFYRPGIQRARTSVIASIMLLFMLVPGFQLVVLMMSGIQYYKAKKNLSSYW